MTRNKKRSPAVCLYWLEEPRTGTAPKYHLDGTLVRLRAAFPSSRVRVVSRRQGNVLTSHTRAAIQALKGLPKSNVLVCRWHPFALPVLAFAKVARVRIVLLVQGTVADARAAHRELSLLPLNWLARRSFRLADAIGVAHAGIGEWTRELGGPRPLVLPNRIPIHDREESSRQAGELLRPSSGRYAIYVGSMVSWQGVETALDALRCEDWPPGVDLVLVGDGPQRAPLQERFPDAHWLGHQPPAIARPLLSGALCALSPKVDDEVTRRGISPFKLLEAADEGVPVIASRVPGQTEWVENHGCGLLVAPGDPRALARAIGRLASDTKLWQRLSERSRRAARANSWTVDADTLAELVEPIEVPGARY